MHGQYRLAVDLGTCHTVAVVRRGDEAPRALLFDGSPLLPSGVYAAPGGELHVGRDGERMSLLDPARFEPYPKRRVDEGTVLLGDTEVTVVGLLAAILRRVVAEARQAGVSPAGATVLTCPADWGQTRRALLLAAARDAGLGQVPLVDEPIAAATYCERVLGRQVVPGQCLAVFDFGGGTLDVTVVRREPEGLRVLAVGGLDDLGGVDVDAALVGHLGQLVELRSPTVWERLENPGSTGELRDRRTFWTEVRGAKEMLSRVSAAPIQVPGRDEALHITREELDRVAGPLVDRAVDETRRVLQRAGVGTAQLAGILLVGGSSRIPLVASRLHTRFGIAPTVPEQPELPVAHGALLATAGPAPAPAFPAPAYPPPAPTSPSMPAGPYPTSPMAGVPVSGGPLAGGGTAPFPMSPAGFPASGPPAGQAERYPAPPPLAAPTSPAQWPSAPPSGPGGAAPPASPRSGGRRRLVVAAVLVVVLVTVCGGGYKVVSKLLTGGLTALTRSSIGSQVGGGGNGPKLDQVGQGVKLGGKGSGAVTTDGQTAYYADVGAGQTQVTALAASDGSQRWTVAVPVEPADVRLTAAGAVVVLDGARSATDGGKPVRAVLDAKSGKLLWKSLWESRFDVAYLGTDEIVSSQDFQSRATMRIDLLTGSARWTRKGADDDIASFDQRRASPAYVWPGPQAPPALVNQADSSVNARTGQFRESLAVDPDNVVELDGRAGKGAVVNAANGQPRSAGALPLDNKTDRWTVFDGLVIGAASDKASPGRARVLALGLSNLAERWHVDQPAGTSIKRVRPCGQHLVCVHAEVSGTSRQTVSAIDTNSHEEQWHKSAEFAQHPIWYLVGGHLIYDNGALGKDEKMVLDPAPGSEGRALGTGFDAPNLVAMDGSRVVTSDVITALPSGDQHWEVAVIDVATGTRSKGADVGAKQPKHVSLSGDVLAVLTDGGEVRVLRVPGAK